MKPKLARNPLRPVRRVDVLHQRNLVARRASLPTDNRAIRQEILPDAKPPLSVFRFYLAFVADPVPVPAPEGSGVMHADGVDAFDFEAGAFEGVDEPAEGSGGVGAREDVFVQEEAPD